MKRQLSKSFVIFFLLAIGVMWCTAASAQERQNQLTPVGAVTSAAPADYVIGPGDLIELRVVGQDQISGKYRVSDAGNLNLPFVGQVAAVGLTELRLTSNVREGLLKFLRQPELSLIVLEFNSKVVTVIGSVGHPGRYPLRHSERLLDAIGMAGGFTDRAGSAINLVRYSPETAIPPTTNEGAAPALNGNIHVTLVNLKELLNGHPELNRQLVSGDIINVPEADTIYVTGNVSKPGAYPIKAPVTLTQAIALAGGLTPEARRSQISLFRSQSGSGERTEMVFSLGELEKRKVKDPMLMPEDVVYIRGSESRSMGLAFLRSLTGGLGNSLGFLVFH